MSKDTPENEFIKNQIRNHNLHGQVEPTYEKKMNLENLYKDSKGESLTVSGDDKKIIITGTAHALGLVKLLIEDVPHSPTGVSKAVNQKLGLEIIVQLVKE